MHDRWLGVWMAGCLDGWMDGWTDLGKISLYPNSSSKFYLQGSPCGAMGSAASLESWDASSIPSLAQLG